MVPPIIEGADGVTLTSTGLIVLREHADFMDNVLARRASDSARAFRLVMTLNHEGIHFLQCFTAAFPYSFSLSILQLCSQLMAVSRSDRLSAGVVQQFRRAFRTRVEQYMSPHQHLTTIDLLEAMAVTEGYRATVVEAMDNADDFHTFLEASFPDPQSEYRKAIAIVSEILGRPAGYELTPRLCYIALNGDTPAENFWYFVNRLASTTRVRSAIPSARALLDMFGMDINASLLKAIEGGLTKDSSHPLFSPYMQALCEVEDLFERYEFAARPGQWLGHGGPAVLQKLVPPLVICSGGRGTIMGLASEWSEEQRFFFLDASAMIGACLALLSGQRHAQTCMHSECPLHSSALCHSWFGKPYGIPWTRCAFPDRLRVQFGKDFKELLSVF